MQAMTKTNTELAIRWLEYAEAKDINSVMAFFTEDAVFSDPHYPKTHMRGHAEIAEGLLWGFNSLKKFGFNITNTHTSADGTSIVISVHTVHELPNGRLLEFPQLFLFEFEDKLIASLQAYVQYEPHGVVGLMLRFTRLANRFLP